MHRRSSHKAVTGKPASRISQGRPFRIEPAAVTIRLSIGPKPDYCGVEMAWQSYAWWDQPEGERVYRTFDPERGLGIKEHDEPTGSSGLTSMLITGPGLNFSFYVRSRSDPDQPNLVINQVYTGGMLDAPHLQWIRPLIAEGLEAFAIRYGFTRPGLRHTTEFLPFGEVPDGCRW